MSQLATDTQELPASKPAETALERDHRITNTLAGFFGTDEWHRLTMWRWLLATDGVHYLAAAAEAFWLIDAIGSHLATNRRLRAEPFQVWTLRLTDERGGYQAVLTAQADTNAPFLVQQWIHYTDFPLADGIKLFCSESRNERGDRCYIVMLPGEY